MRQFKVTMVLNLACEHDKELTEIDIQKAKVAWLEAISERIFGEGVFEATDTTFFACVKQDIQEQEWQDFDWEMEDAAFAASPEGIAMKAKQQTEDEDDWGCEYCRNERTLNDNDCCPKCDAQFDPEDEDEE